MAVTKLKLKIDGGDDVTLQGYNLTTADVLAALNAPPAEDDTANAEPVTPAMLAAMDAESDYARMSDFALWLAWYQPDCPGCHEFGAPLPNYCPDCGTDRSADSALWMAVEARNVDWLSVRARHEGGEQL